MTSPGREWLKWIALVLMTGDHINAGLLGRDVPLLYDLGRIVMPAFAAVLAYNLAQHSLPDVYGDARSRLAILEARYLRVGLRLCGVGLVAYPFHVLVLGQGLWTLNILFGYAVAVCCMWLIDRWGWRGAIAAGWLIAMAGFLLEFLWAAPLVTLAWWAFWRYNRPGRLDRWWALLLGATGLLCVINGNLWAMAAIPLVLLVARVKRPLRRYPWTFYAYYPAHLAVLAVVAQLR